MDCNKWWNYSRDPVDITACKKRVSSDDNCEGEDSDQLSELSGYLGHTKKKADEGSGISRAASTTLPKGVGNEMYPQLQIKGSADSTEPYCHVKLNSIMKLKDSTRKLLSLLSDIHAKTPSKHPSDTYMTTNSVLNSVTDFCASALKRLESQAKILDTWPAPFDDDDCSIYKRLTRKCNCLNQQEYNDFIIHFNEQVKYSSNTQGEIIKNLRILKKFLYMGGNYTKNALVFLNEGFKDSTYSEKVEITQGCAYADICNVFEDASIAIICIAWPYKYDTYGDSVTQELAASFIHKLAQLEEGRRYLKLSSKLTNDIKKILRKKGTKLDYNTLEMLYAILNLLHPTNALENRNDIQYCRPDDEGFATQTMKNLVNYRKYMTVGEIFIHLDLLNKLSTEERSREELERQLRTLIVLFEDMLLVHDDSEMNIIIINILNNLITPKVLKLTNQAWPRIYATVDEGHGPIPELQEKIEPTKSSAKTRKPHRVKKDSKQSLADNALENDPDINVLLRMKDYKLRQVIKEEEQPMRRPKSASQSLHGRRRRRHKVVFRNTAASMLNVSTLSDKNDIIVVPLEKSKQKIK